MAFADRDFTHITLLATGANVLVANLEFPAKNFAEFLALAKANPGKYSHASSGTGASGHLSMEMLKQAPGISLVHVPYRGRPRRPAQGRSQAFVRRLGQSLLYSRNPPATASRWFRCGDRNARAVQRVREQRDG